MSDNQYKAHTAESGGLQGHSIGGTYPIGVFGKETDHGTRYGVMNFATGEELSFGFSTCAAAHQQARIHQHQKAHVKHATIKAILNAGGHHA